MHYKTIGISNGQSVRSSVSGVSMVSTARGSKSDLYEKESETINSKPFL